MARIYLDSFSGGVGFLKRKEKQDPLVVLRVLRHDPMVSTWDMATVWKTIDILRQRGWVEEIQHDYPWHEFRITPKGCTVLKGE